MRQPQRVEPPSWVSGEQLVHRSDDADSAYPDVELIVVVALADSGTSAVGNVDAAGIEHREHTLDLAFGYQPLPELAQGLPGVRLHESSQVLLRRRWQRQPQTNLRYKNR